MVKKKSTASNGQTEPLPKSLDTLNDGLVHETGFKLTPAKTAAHPAFKVGDMVYIKESLIYTDSDDAAGVKPGEEFVGYVDLRHRQEVKRPLAQRSTERLRHAVDWFPSPRTRKVLVKMVADQESLIAQLMKDGRVKTARWQIGVTWVLIAYTGTLHLVASLMSALRGKQRTN